MECLGVLQDGIREDHVWRETLGRNLRSHGAVERVGGMCYGNSYRQ